MPPRHGGILHYVRSIGESCLDTRLLLIIVTTMIRRVSGRVRDFVHYALISYRVVVTQYGICLRVMNDHLSGTSKVDRSYLSLATALHSPPILQVLSFR